MILVVIGLYLRGVVGLSLFLSFSSSSPLLFFPLLFFLASSSSLFFFHFDFLKFSSHTFANTNYFSTDPSPLHALTLQAQHAHAQRNIPPTTQMSPLSDLQLLVKGARKTIVDPVLALFADLSDDEDEELTAEGKKERDEARERERQREKIRELKRRKIRAWGGLSLPSSSSRGGGKVKGEEGGVFIRRDVDDESMDVDIGDGVNGCELTRSMEMGMPPASEPVFPDAPRSRKPSRKARSQVYSEEKEGEEERPRKKARLPNLKSTPNAQGKADAKEKANGKEKSNGKEKTKTKGKEKDPKPQPDTYKQAWSVSEQHLLEQLLEQIPEGERFRWQKISRAMNGTRTPRQVASRVQKYFEKLKKFGVEGY